MNKMKILMIGDISGQPGRETVAKVLPGLREKFKFDLVIANAENSAGGFGATKAILTELQSYGVDYFTMGDHTWRRKEFVAELEDKSLPVVRPYNYEKQMSLPGKGIVKIDLGARGSILLANLLGQSYNRDHVRSPFWASEDLEDEIKRNGWEDLPLIIDFHCESTAEKICFAHIWENKASAVLGTHTHVATADQRLLGDTGFVSDVGMAGPYDASLWIKFEVAVNNFMYPVKLPAEMEESGRRIFNSVLVEIEGKKCKKISRLDKVLEG
jgi:metallophosphoesterase (TIGR00282 family)